MTHDQRDALITAFRNAYGAEVEAEPVSEQGRYRFAVVSLTFREMTHLQRQDALWQLVDATVARDVALDVSIILAFAPEELSAAADSK